MAQESPVPRYNEKYGVALKYRDFLRDHEGFLMAILF